MNIVTLDSAKPVDNVLGLDVRLAVESEELEIVQFILKPGEAIPPHALPVRVYFFVLEGCGEITINGRTEVVSENSLIESPPGADRGWKAIGDTSLRVLAVKVMKSDNLPIH